MAIFFVREMSDDFIDDEDSDLEESTLTYQGNRFKITADPENELECAIVREFQRDANLQQALHFTDPNRLFHSENYLGQHIENSLRYERRISNKYNSWRKDSPILRPLVMWHDVAKAWESWYPHSQDSPKIGHREIAAMIAPEVLNISDDQFNRLVLHHDDYYKLFNRRTKRDIDDDVQQVFQGFAIRDFEILVRFIHCDCYRQRPKSASARSAYNHQKKLYQEQIEWFVKTLKGLHLLNRSYRAFS